MPTYAMLAVSVAVRVAGQELPLKNAFNFKLHLLRCVGAGDRNSQFLTTHIFRLMMAQLCKLVNSGQSKVIPRSDLHRECARD